MSTRRTGPNVLGIYLNDHLAGATAGTELDELVARAGRQADLLEDLRVRAADQVISLESNP